MTIVSSVKVRDGLVLGTDSMTQIVATLPDGSVVFAKAYNNARKLFQVGASAGVMTFGLGNIGDHSIEGLVRAFRQERPAEIEAGVAIGDLANLLFAFIEPRWRDAVGEEPEPQHTLGFVVAGYSPDAPFAEMHEFVLPRDNGSTIVSGQDDFGLLWRGIDTPLIRLLKGWDPRLPAALEARGIPAEEIMAMIGPLEWFLAQPGMPIQDAVNLVEYLLSTTVGISSFVDTNPTCGGPLQIAAILPDRGFVWISQPEITLSRREHTA